MHLFLIMLDELVVKCFRTAPSHVRPLRRPSFSLATLSRLSFAHFHSTYVVALANQRWEIRLQFLAAKFSLKRYFSRLILSFPEVLEQRITLINVRVSIVRF